MRGVAQQVRREPSVEAQDGAGRARHVQATIGRGGSYRPTYHPHGIDQSDGSRPGRIKVVYGQVCAQQSNMESERTLRAPDGAGR